jgi:hypothetical protein
MASNNRAIGLPPAAVFTPMPMRWACAAGKATRNPFPSAGNQTSRPLELLQIDIAGPILVTSAGGSIFFIMVLNDFMNFKAAKLILKKSDATVFVKLIIQNLQMATGYKTQSNHHDQAKELMAQQLKGWYPSRGI